MSMVDFLLASAIDEKSVQADSQNSNYTIPRTWGVYEIVGSAGQNVGRRFRRGNHPIRHKELLREFGSVDLVA